MPRASFVQLHVGGYNPYLFYRCHELVSWSFTLTATNDHSLFYRCHELVSWSFTLAATVARNVKLHETSSWHLKSNGRLM